MKIYAVNGSPRKTGNTATLLNHALDGAKSCGAETEIIHLYDLNFTGCRSCFECKRIGGQNYGRCPIKDDLHDILPKISIADGIIFGAPVYFSVISGQMQCFLERFLFPYVVYDKAMSKIAPKQMPTAFFYTLNIANDDMDSYGYPDRFIKMENTIGAVLTPPKRLIADNTYQFSDYSKYVSDRFSEEDKRSYKEAQFPIDCKNAYDIGANLLKQ